MQRIGSQKKKDQDQLGTRTLPVEKEILGVGDIMGGGLDFGCVMVK